jgi:hypothetical protein
LFEGLEVKASLIRNKLGRSGLSAQWRSMVSPPDLPGFIQTTQGIRSA